MMKGLVGGAYDSEEEGDGADSHVGLTSAAGTAAGTGFFFLTYTCFLDVQKGADAI